METEEEQLRRESRAASEEDLRDFRAHPRPRRIQRTAERAFVSWNSAEAALGKAAIFTLPMLGGLAELKAGFSPLGIALTLAGLPALVYVSITALHVFRIVKSGVLVKFGEPVIAVVTASEFIINPGWGYSRVTYRFQTTGGRTHTGSAKKADDLPGGHQLIVLYLAIAPTINMDYDSSFFQVLAEAPTGQ